MLKYLPFLHYIRRHLVIFIIAVVCGIVFGVTSGFGIPLIVDKVLRVIFEASEGTYSLAYILGVAALIPIAVGLRGAAGFANAYLMAYCGLFISVQLKEAIFAKLQSLDLAYHTSRSTGDMMTRVNSDANNVQVVLLEVSAEIIRQPFQMLSALVVLGYLAITNQDVIFLLLFILTIPICLLPVGILGKKLRRRSREIQISYSDLSQAMIENLGAITEIRTYGLEESQQRQFDRKLQENLRLMLKQKKYERLQQPIMEIITTAIIGAVFAYCYMSKIDFATFSAMGIGLYMAFDPLKKIMRLVNLANQYEASAERITEILSEEPIIRDPENPVALQQARGDIQFQNLSFAYDETPVLQDINVQLPAGSVCALVGASGAGKSTFAKLIPRLYEAGSGAVLVDGNDIRNYRLSDLRRNIAVVSQQPVLFDDSIMENIRLGRPEASDEDIYQAAQRAFADRFIRDLDEGYQTRCGERGERLSGGQRQRIALARAFLKNAPILILDEATSALDSESEHYIQTALQDLMQGKTVIIIAHRYSTIRHANRVLVFQNGRIVEDGNHNDLLSLNGVYARLYKTQVSGLETV